MKRKKIIIVGGNAGGATAAARLRRLDEKAEIILFERGKFVSFANCGLVYYIGGKISQKESLLVQTPESIKKRFDIDVRILSEVLNIYPKTKQVAVLDLKTGKKYKESYDQLILSPGAKPFKPPIPGIDHFRVFSVKNITDAEAIKNFIAVREPKKAVILGGGPIGLEMAESLKGLGLEVAIVELGNHVFAPLDLDMAAIVHNHLRLQGVELFLETQVKSIEHKKDQSILITNTGKQLEADIILLGIGVMPETELASKAGLKIGKTGGIEVNSYLLTSDPFIYAIGDAIEVKNFITDRKVLLALAGPANKQGRIAAGNIAGKKEKFRGSQGTGVNKCFDITIASTGLNEAALLSLGVLYKTSIIHGLSHAGYYPGALPISLKIIFGNGGKIYGAQAVGVEGVEKRIDVIATAIRAQMKVKDLEEIDLCYAPPYSSVKDPVNMVASTATNILKGLVKNFTYEDIKNINLKNSILLDVRTKLEFKIGSIEGSVNIPVDELRSSLKVLPQNKNIYVFCATGLRSYTACRILTQNGFRCFNLSGGYDTYKAVMGREYSLPADTETSADLFNDQETDSNQWEDKNMVPNVKIKLDTCGLSCPGPLQRVYSAIKNVKKGEVLEIKATDSAFISDIAVWCKSTDNRLLSLKTETGITTAYIQKGDAEHSYHIEHPDGRSKTIVVFSDSLDKVIACFIIANGAAAMGRDMSMFFTFWGLNVLKRPEAVYVKKDFLSKCFAIMMPRGTKNLHLSQMEMGGMGHRLIRHIMIKKHIGTLEQLIEQAREAGVKLIACSTSMDIMGIKKEELIDGVEIGGVATFLGESEEADTNLFV